MGSHAASQTADVYGITVSSEHVFFADSVLVANCDELRYFARHVLTNDYSHKAKPHKFEPGTLGAILGHGKKRKKRRRGL